MAIEVSFGFPADGGSEVEPLFADDFESYTVGSTVNDQGANGFLWRAQRNVRVSDQHSYSGTRSLWFPFGPTEPDGSSHWWSEQRFSHPSVQEYWMEFYWRVPDNYYHNFGGGTANNNKFLAWWGPNGYEGPQIGTFQTWSRSDQPGASRIDVNRVVEGESTPTYPRGPGSSSPFIDASDRGSWLRIRIHIRQSDPGQSNGIQRLWKNDEIMVDVTNDPNSTGDPATNNLTDGYLMGYDNGRFLEDHDFFIDNFKFWVQNPGW